MRLLKMDNPRPGQRVQCALCYAMIPGDEALADLEGPAGTFYHRTCSFRARLFCGVFAGGISYADQAIEKDGDFKKLAFLDFRSLTLKIEPDCPAEFRQLIEADAAEVQRKRGQEFQVSACGQTVRLGGE